MTTRQLLDQFAEVAGAKRVATVKRALVGSNATEAYVSAAETDRVHLLAVQVTCRMHQVVHLLPVGKTTLLRTISGKLIWTHVVWDKQLVAEAATHVLPVSTPNTGVGRHPSWQASTPCSIISSAYKQGDLRSGTRKQVFQVQLHVMLQAPLDKAVPPHVIELLRASRAPVLLMRTNQQW